MRIDVTICVEDEPGGSNVQVTLTDELALDAEGVNDLALTAVRRVHAALDVDHV